MRKSTKPLQNLQGFCKKLQKILKTVKDVYKRQKKYHEGHMPHGILCESK